MKAQTLTLWTVVVIQLYAFNTSLWLKKHASQQCPVCPTFVQTQFLIRHGLVNNIGGKVTESHNWSFSCGKPADHLAGPFWESVASCGYLRKLSIAKRRRTIF